MANKQQISFALAFLVGAMILLTNQATAAEDDAHAKGFSKADVEAVIKDLIAATEHAKSKVPSLGSSELVEICDKAYEAALESLHKALAVLNGQDSEKHFADLHASVEEAYKGYVHCDDVYTQSTRPSPFMPNNINLKDLVAKLNEYYGKSSKN